MKKIVVIFFSSLLLLSCGSNQKNTHRLNSSPKYINVVESPNGFSSAYTDDGHTIIYETDSAKNYVIYYAKFDDNAGKKGYDRVKDKAIRIETDSSMNRLTCFASVNGGASCQIDDNGEYQVCYFDDEMNRKTAELHEIHLEEQFEGIESLESKIKRIIYLLIIARDVAKEINEHNIGGWNYIVYALEPSIDILNYDVMIQKTVFEPKAKEHISKLSSTTEGLSHFNSMLRNKKNEPQNK